MGVVENTPTWFVMRDLKRPNALSPAWRTLPGMGFEVFTPMRARIVMRKGVPVREILPVVNDLLFVSAERMDIVLYSSDSRGRSGLPRGLAKIENTIL